MDMTGGALLDVHRSLKPVTWSMPRAAVGCSPTLTMMPYEVHLSVFTSHKWSDVSSFIYDVHTSVHATCMPLSNMVHWCVPGAPHHSLCHATCFRPEVSCSFLIGSYMNEAPFVRNMLTSARLLTWWHTVPKDVYLEGHIPRAYLGLLV